MLLYMCVEMQCVCVLLQTEEVTIKPHIFKWPFIVGGQGHTCARYVLHCVGKMRDHPSTKLVFLPLLGIPETVNLRHSCAIIMLSNQDLDL